MSSQSQSIPQTTPATARPTVADGFKGYLTEGFFDEVLDPAGVPREAAARLMAHLAPFPMDEFCRRQSAAERILLQLGITFNVYGREKDTEKIFPFDTIPRIIAAREWDWIDRGLRQRIRALNLFLDDIYHDRKILKDKVIPPYIVESSKGYLRQLEGLNPPRRIWCHVTGTDLIRDGDGSIYVLEDNLRVPSGVSYVLENREVMKRTFPTIFKALNVRPIRDYPSHLLDTLQSLAPDHVGNPRIGVLTPGIYNSAYYEHSFLAHQMGEELVEGRDLVVQDGRVMMRTTKGFEAIDVIYRRVDDTFIDPKVFRADSLLGVPGLMDVYRAGRVALANAPGTGIADDKVVYAYVPQIVKYYLDEDIIIPNVPTYVCWEEDQLEYVVKNIEKLVVKAADESGGYGMMVGPHADAATHAKFRDLVRAEPRKYIAQPTISLSRVPVLVDRHFEGRHVDLRPFILYGRDMKVMPGGLCRVALKKGSLVVNSSQGGGSKDAWVLRD